MRLKWLRLALVAGRLAGAGYCLWLARMQAADPLVYWGVACLALGLFSLALLDRGPGERIHELDEDVFVEVTLPKDSGHYTSGQCWCGPEKNGRVIVHRSRQ